MALRVEIEGVCFHLVNIQPHRENILRVPVMGIFNNNILGSIMDKMYFSTLNRTYGKESQRPVRQIQG